MLAETSDDWRRIKFQFFRSTFYDYGKNDWRLAATAALAEDIRWWAIIGSHLAGHSLTAAGGCQQGVMAAMAATVNWEI